MSSADTVRATLEQAVTFLFVPGDSPRKLERALASDADVVIADLEDAVMPADKAAARQTVAQALAAARTGPARIVRVNCVGGRPDADDLEAAAAAGTHGIMLPKADAAAIGHVPHGMPVVALVETARGLCDAPTLARHPDVVRIAIGTVDLAVELGLRADYDDPLPLLFARSQLVLDCAAAGAPAPADGVHTDVRDLDGLRRADRHARSLGLHGRLCLHPSQVPVVAKDFRPSEDELGWARRVVAAYRRADAAGALSLDGEMVDEAVAKRAERLLRDARR